MKVTIELVVDIDPKAHPIPDLVKYIENRTCTIPGVIDANRVQKDATRDTVTLPVVDAPPKAAA